MGPGHGGKFLSPPARPVPPTPGSVSQASQAWLAPWELRPRKSGSQDPNNWGAHGGRQQKLQVAAITLLRPLLHMQLAPSSGRKTSWYTQDLQIQELGMGLLLVVCHFVAVQP